MASRPARAHPLLGKVVAGRYRVLQLLASGGLGDVLLAERVGAGADARSRVAVKVLREEHRAKRGLAARFRRDAEAALLVKHDNVVAVIEPPTDRGGALCFVAELLVGLDLADTLAYSGSLGAARAARIALGVAEGLAAAHAAGVIHRDVKPENIFLVHAADGREAVKLVDFGLAFVPGDDPASTRVVGTPEYMAPELAAGAPASPEADVYSLGIVLYEMLAGRAPFVAPYPEIARLHASAPWPPLRPRAQLSDELEAVVAQALAKDPALRFGSMRALVRALLATPEVASSPDMRRP